MKLRKYATVLRGGGVGLTELAVELLEEAGPGGKPRVSMSCRDGCTGWSTNLWRTWRLEFHTVVASDEVGGL